MKQSFKVTIYFKRGGIYNYDFTKEEFLKEFLENRKRDIAKVEKHY